ncbi:hypothetical protein MD484_g1504, partial [Candolleomyces efflorescens]
MPYHHYIPRFILRGFIPESTASPVPAGQGTKKQRQREARKARKKGQPDPQTISVYDLQSRSIKTVPIAKEFGVCNFYQDAQNPEDLEHLEKKLSELENKAAHVIRNLHISAGSQASKQTFTLLRSDLQVLRKFIFLMHYRSSATEKTYFQEDHPRNAPIRQWIRHLKQSKGYTTDNEVWLDGLRYYLSTKHSEILEHAKQCSEYGPFQPIGETNIDIPSHQWHALAYESFTNSNYLGIWKSHKDSEFVLGHNSYGIWEGTLAETPRLFKLYVISPKIAIVLKLSMSKTLPSFFEDSTLSDHPLGFAQTVYSRGPRVLGDENATPTERYEALQRHLQSPNSNNDQFTFSINGLTVNQTYLVNQVVLENLHADGLLVFASRNAMLPTARRYDTPEGPFLKKNREAIAGLVRCLESGASGNPSTGSQPGVGTSNPPVGSSSSTTPPTSNFMPPPNEPMFVRRPRVTVGLDDLMLPKEVIEHIIGRNRPDGSFENLDWGDEDVAFDFLLYNILEGGVTFESEYDRAVTIHRNFPPLPSTVYPLVHFIAKRMTEARKLIEVFQSLAENRVEVKFSLGTPTKLVDSLGEKESKHLLHMLSLHVESLGLGWVMRQWDGESTESQKILEQVTIVAYLELLLEVDPNLAASLCSSVSFVEVAERPTQPPSEAHLEEVEEVFPMRDMEPGVNIDPLSSTSSPQPTPFTSFRPANPGLGGLLLPRELETDSAESLFSELDRAFDDMLLDIVEDSVVFETGYERAIYIHQLFPPLPNTAHPLVHLVGERMLEVQGTQRLSDCLLICALSLCYESPWTMIDLQHMEDITLCWHPSGQSLLRSPRMHTGTHTVSIRLPEEVEEEKTDAGVILRHPTSGSLLKLTSINTGRTYASTALPFMTRFISILHLLGTLTPLLYLYQIPMAEASSISFDYIVIGGGTAGLAVASRLAEDNSRTVLVLEAGKDVSNETSVRVPGLWPAHWGMDYDWKTSSAPTENVGPVHMPRGKGSGGSSIINLMQLGRAPSTEYDALEAWGNTGWNAAELNRYFKKSQTLAYNKTKADEFGLKPNPALYGSGPILNTLPKVTAEVYPSWVEAYKELGVPFNPTADGGENLGVWPGAAAIHNQTVTRITSATAYYEPNQGKRNLKVITSAHVSRIIFKKARDGQGVIATGVEYIVDGTNTTTIVQAKKEVILSAGSLMTPQILELSGIGDPKILNQHNIPVLVDLPGVGNNLRTSYLFTIPVLLPHLVQRTIRAFPFDNERLQRELSLYQSGEGLLTTVAIYFSFLNLPQFVDEPEKLKSIAKALEKNEIDPEIKATLESWLGRDDISQLEYVFRR